MQSRFLRAIHQPANLQPGSGQVRVQPVPAGVPAQPLAAVAHAAARQLDQGELQKAAAVPDLPAQFQGAGHAAHAHEDARAEAAGEAADVQAVQQAVQVEDDSVPAPADASGEARAVQPVLEAVLLGQSAAVASDQDGAREELQVRPLQSDVRGRVRTEGVFIQFTFLAL